jgi:hypothetical protein
MQASLGEAATRLTDVMADVDTVKQRHTQLRAKMIDVRAQQGQRQAQQRGGGGGGGGGRDVYRDLSRGGVVSEVRRRWPHCGPCGIDSVFRGGVERTCMFRTRVLSLSLARAHRSHPRPFARTPAGAGGRAGGWWWQRGVRGHPAGVVDGTRAAGARARAAGTGAPTAGAGAPAAGTACGACDGARWNERGGRFPGAGVAGALLPDRPAVADHRPVSASETETES